MATGGRLKPCSRGQRLGPTKAVRSTGGEELAAGRRRRLSRTSSPEASSSWLGRSEGMPTGACSDFHDSGHRVHRMGRRYVFESCLRAALMGGRAAKISDMLENHP